MTLHASWPSWVIFMLMMMFIGPMIRLTFGGGLRSSRRWRRGLGDSDGVARLEGAIAERDNVIEDLQRRLSEMESRVDFAERMLARPPDSLHGSEVKLPT